MISIETDRQSYAPGQAVDATIRLALAKPVKARGLVARLTCEERRRTTEQRIMDKYDYDREKELGGFKETHMYSTTVESQRTVFDQSRSLSGEMEYADGEFRVSFAIPAAGPPTSHEFGHDNKIHVWRLRVKLDIPFALDENAEKEIFVEGL